MYNVMIIFHKILLIYGLCSPLILYVQTLKSIANYGSWSILNVFFLQYFLVVIDKILSNEFQCNHIKYWIIWAISWPHVFIAEWIMPLRSPSGYEVFIPNSSHGGPNQQPINLPSHTSRIIFRPVADVWFQGNRDYSFRLIKLKILLTYE